jgi:hypothetical protein
MMATQSVPHQLCWPTLPLAVYREIAAHLQQVSGVEVELLPQTASSFDYELSQVGGLQIKMPSSMAPESYQRVQEILEYYRDCFGEWQLLDGCAVEMT